MKNCTIDETIVHNIRSEITPIIAIGKYKFDKANIKTHTEQYVKMCTTVDNLFVEFYFIDINIQRTTNNNVELYNYECPSIILKTYIRPIHTTVLYLDDESINNAFIITNLDDNAYKFKQFANESAIYMSYPKKGSQIEFNGGHYYGKIKTGLTVADNMPSYVLIINSFKEPPHYAHQLKTYSAKTSELADISLSEIIYTNPCIMEDDLLTYDFFNDLLYKKQIVLKQTMTCVSQNEPFVQIIKPEIKVIKQVCDVAMLISETTLIDNRFLQRFTKNIYSYITCKWMIDEYIKYNNHTNSLMMEKMPQVFSYVLFSFKEIIDFFIKSYCIDNDIQIKITPGIINKYKSSHDIIASTNNNSITCMLSLSSNTSIDFKDGLKCDLEQGGLLLYKNQPFEVASSVENKYMLLFDITII